MKLFCFQPNGHGEASYFVVARNEAIARKKVTSFIKQQSDGYMYNLSAWLGDGENDPYYRCSVFKIGEVAVNSND
jgi:hypothetical protein